MRSRGAGPETPITPAGLQTEQCDPLGRSRSLYCIPRNPPIGNEQTAFAFFPTAPHSTRRVTACRNRRHFSQKRFRGRTLQTQRVASPDAVFIFNMLKPVMFRPHIGRGRCNNFIRPPCDGLGRNGPEVQAPKLCQSIALLLELSASHIIEGFANILFMAGGCPGWKGASDGDVNRAAVLYASIPRQAEIKTTENQRL